MLAARRVLQSFREIDSKLSLTEALILLDVALGEGPADMATKVPEFGSTVTLLATRYAIPQPTMTRTIGVLAKGVDAKGNGKGPQLIEQFKSEVSKDRRTTQLRLTPFGRMELTQSIRKAVPHLNKEGINAEPEGRQSGPDPGYNDNQD